jgi:hypothetical protein
MSEGRSARSLEAGQSLYSRVLGHLVRPMHRFEECSSGCADLDRHVFPNPGASVLSGKGKLRIGLLLTAVTAAMKKMVSEVPLEVEYQSLSQLNRSFTR